VRLICAPKKKTHITIKCIVINVTNIINLLHSRSLTKINDNNKSKLIVHPWHHKADLETPPRSTRTPHCTTPLGPPVLLLWEVYISQV
jgi:hypothetical protein